MSIAGEAGDSPLNGDDVVDAVEVDSHRYVGFSICLESGIPDARWVPSAAAPGTRSRRPSSRSCSTVDRPRSQVTSPP